METIETFHNSELKTKFLSLFSRYLEKENIEINEVEKILNEMDPEILKNQIDSYINDLKRKKILCRSNVDFTIKFIIPYLLKKKLIRRTKYLNLLINY